ncbi:unnamed protein product, partial [Urochloa humidicola]
GAASILLQGGVARSCCRKGAPMVLQEGATMVLQEGAPTALQQEGAPMLLQEGAPMVLQEGRMDPKTCFKLEIRIIATNTRTR